MLVLYKRLAGPVDLDQGRHQFHVQPVVKAVNVQGLPAYAHDIGILRLAFQHLNVGINRRHELVVQGGRLGQCPFVLLAVLKQVAFVFLQQQVVQFPLFRRGNVVLRKTLENRVDLVQVDRHVIEAFPVVSPSVRNDALPQFRIDLVQQHT